MAAGSTAALDAWAKVDVPAVKQAQSKWCWAACCEAFTRFYDRHIMAQHQYLLLCRETQESSKFQEALAQQVHGKRGGTLNDYANPTQYIELLEAVIGAKLKLVEPGRGTDQRPTRDQVKGTLMKGRIFILGSERHSRILCGYGVKPQGTEEGLYCMDPMQGAVVWEKWSLYDSCTSLIWAPRGTFA